MPDIDITDSATPELTRLASELDRPRRLMAACGKQLELDVRKHFLDRDTEPNKKGFPVQHFWKREGADHTQLTEVTDNSATVTIASPAIAHKYEGGTITASRAGALSIPLTPEAARVGSASLFPRPLTLITRPGRPPLLIEKQDKVEMRTVKSPKTEGEPQKKFKVASIIQDFKWTIQYVLLKSVTQVKDPRTLPDKDAVTKSILDRARSVVARITGAK